MHIGRHPAAASCSLSSFFSPCLACPPYIVRPKKNNMPWSSGKFLYAIVSIIAVVIRGVATVHGLAAPHPPRGTNPPPRNLHRLDRQYNGGRRALVSSASSALIATFLTTSTPKIVNARYVLNESTGEYDEVVDEDWQTTWGKRLDKARSMSTEDVFLAAQGAGNVDVREGEGESEASRKRRALAGCRNDRLRQLSGMVSSKECTARVLRNDYMFMIDAM